MTNIINAQVMLPAYQGVQTGVSIAVAPTVTTTAVTSINDSTVTTGGNVTNSGGGAITARGVCWSYTTGPTIADNVTTNGTGTGSFTSNPSLGPGAPYYLRAYATNSAGTSYGSEVTFTTTAVAVTNYYRGGYVAYLKKSGDNGYSPTIQHGFIMPAVDQSVGAIWNNGTGLAISTSPVMGNGNANTINIIAAYGAGTYAAALCDDLVVNNYSDWFLGSYNELLAIFATNATALSSTPGFTPVSGAYWTSFNNGNTLTAYTMLTNGTGGPASQSQARPVRAVRSF